MDGTNDNRDVPHRSGGARFDGAADALGGPDVFGRALARWAADAIVDEAVAGRSRARWMRLAGEEEASMLGTLVDLAEQARSVTLDVGTQRVRGVVIGVGSDFVALRSERGQQLLIRVSAIDVVQARPGSRDLVGARSPTLDTNLVGVLGPLAAERPDVLVRTGSDVTVRGTLRSAGRDVIRLRPDTDEPTPTWVAIESIDMLTIEL